MTKVIEFPSDRLRENSHHVVAFSDNKNKYTIGLSICALVFALSIFNSKNSSPSITNAQKGMRGLASVEQPNSKLENKNWLRLIREKSNRRSTRLGRNPTAVDSLVLSPSVAQNYALVRNSQTGFVKRLVFSPGGTKTYFESIIQSHLSAFGADMADCGEPGELIDGEYKYAYCQLSQNSGEQGSLLTAKITPDGKLLDLNIEPQVLD